MKKRILFVLALFFMLTGFNGEDRIVEQNGVNLQESFDNEYFGPTFMEKPKVFTAEDGSEVIITARFKGKPKPTVTWYRNSSIIKESAKITIRVITEGENLYTTMLSIKKPTIVDYGKYKVELKNEAGEASAYKELN